MHPYLFFMLLADRNGHQAYLRFSRELKQWERFVPEYGGGRWEPFLGIDWPAPTATNLFGMGFGPHDRATVERS